MKPALSRSCRKAKSYVAYRKPGIAPRAGNRTWKVADLLAAYGEKRGDAPGGGVIGILELGGGYKQSDLDAFSQANGIPQIIVTDVNVSATNSPGGDADDEVALDIQVAAAAYFYKTGKMPVIKVLWMANTTDAFAAACQVALDNGCDVLSISWGADEQSWGQESAARFDAAAAAATAKGLTIFASAGDNSAGDGDPGANVDLPAASPHVCSCGGTTKTSSSETVWGDGNSTSGGTGGGFSSFFPSQPWQYDVPGNPGRMVPDFSAVADPQTGYEIYLNGPQVIGGTSAVSPLYAGLSASAGPKRGNILPAVWLNPTAFADITQGSNGYQAQIGPDPATGLGVPTGNTVALLTTIQNGVVATKPTQPVQPPPVDPIPTQPLPAISTASVAGVVTIQNGKIVSFKTDIPSQSTPLVLDGFICDVKLCDTAERSPVKEHGLMDTISLLQTKMQWLVDTAASLVQQYKGQAASLAVAVQAFVDAPGWGTAESLYNEVLALKASIPLCNVRAFDPRIGVTDIAAIIQEVLAAIQLFYQIKNGNSAS